ncbi:hypothetical protein IFT66_08745 [Rhizobium sp. CFBP 13726]|uniref:hypothetical protein n=1 Tax=Rhizobium sp. CFBP 13726 TaxID=2775296 RepID=UPI00177E5DA1|nr:hypothetical protein [Rhizobium sp. CFBP 13726]MBD8651160.1 hypothetical protein [Rhizobium sp. CFBP 13726]
MKSHVLNRVGEINEHLGPLLEELGIGPKIQRYADGAIYIEFKSKDGNIISPVEIQLGRCAMTTTTASSWRGSEMCGTFWENIAIGDSGWVHQKFLNSESRYEMTADREAVFEKLSTWLRGHGLLYLDRSRDGYFTDDNFARTYAVIKNAMLADEDVAIGCERCPDFDSFVFSCPEGHNWRVSLDGLDVTVLLDGHEEISVKTHELEQLGKAIYERLRRFRLEAALGF